MSTTESLERLKLWVQIISTIALPVVVFVVGNQVQSSIATQELGKSYVQMAVDVLKAPPTPETSELRQWAVATIDKNSPIPLSKELRDQLKRGSVEFKTASGGVGAKESHAVAGIVMYTKCEKVVNAETAKWMIKNNPKTFAECSGEDEVGVREIKPQEGPLKEGEKLISADPVDSGRLSGGAKNEPSVRCVKTKNKATADWLLNNYGSYFLKCPNSDEVGVFKNTVARK